MILVRLFLMALLAFSFTGCSKFFNIGENKGYCEENGCDYSDAGLCADPYEIYKYRGKIKNQPYQNIQCECGKKGSSGSLVIKQER